ncbi:hypothetical protein SB87_gp010 [Parapoxvirus red deer/HL953]|uniref:Uncharacterized protein n=1 Tax=Parapoxvirus red deer/HL953 TaxID=1579460 RepID=A0A0A7MA48_9POXV|nr:hypothetical protein SB87_gp010 [Parapoxvirus red deer/HL953]AIZ77263.1 hypothetical protein [Parapoxvirus red deer/HL953]
MGVLLGLSIAAVVVFGSVGICTLGLELYVLCAERRLAARREAELEELMLHEEEGEFVNY